MARALVLSSILLALTACGGGFIETSGGEYLDLGSAPDASAPRGAAGTWLIDPVSVTIQKGTDDGNLADPGDMFLRPPPGSTTVNDETIEAAVKKRRRGIE